MFQKLLLKNFIKSFNTPCSEANPYLQNFNDIIKRTTKDIPKEKIKKLETLVKNSIEEIDILVYELYGLSVDEVKIIEDK